MKVLLLSEMINVSMYRWDTPENPFRFSPDSMSPPVAQDSGNLSCSIWNKPGTRDWNENWAFGTSWEEGWNEAWTLERAGTRSWNEGWNEG